jgi:hypothetical protein
VAADVVRIKAEKNRDGPSMLARIFKVAHLTLMLIIIIMIFIF